MGQLIAWSEAEFISRPGTVVGDTGPQPELEKGKFPTVSPPAKQGLTIYPQLIVPPGATNVRLEVHSQYMDERRDMEETTLIPFDGAEHEFCEARELPRVTDAGGIRLTAEIRTFHSERGRRSRLKAVYEDSHSHASPTPLIGAGVGQTFLSESDIVVPSMDSHGWNGTREITVIVPPGLVIGETKALSQFKNEGRPWNDPLNHIAFDGGEHSWCSVKLLRPLPLTGGRTLARALLWSWSHDQERTARLQVTAVRAL